MFLCSIGQAEGSISFSHLPFLQGQGTPALMAARAHMFPSALGFDFGFLPTWSVLFAPGNQTAPGCIQLARAEMLSLLWHNQNVPGSHCCEKSTAEGRR